MKKVRFQPSFLQVIYLVIYVLLFSLIVYVPTLINGPVRISHKLVLEESMIEGVLLGILFIVSILLLNLYKNEKMKQQDLIQKISLDKRTTEEKLTDAFKYIGQINVQVEEIKSIFNKTNLFPQTYNDFRKTLLFYSEQTFGIVQYNWVLFRIIDCKTHKTLGEHFQNRLGYAVECPHVSNKAIAENHSCFPYTTVISSPTHLNILTCCLLPEGELTNEEKVFLQAITNEITMIFVLLESSYTKTRERIQVEEKYGSGSLELNGRAISDQITS
ncbi:MAG TPA: hypothetical protein VJ963_05045 [Bacteroidales bacterium]|nr:hypothetical protein [Bacteroidales bacterium]